MAFNSFEDLDVLKKGREVRLFVSKIIRKIPIEEKYAFTHQVKRASRSITNNIAEGFGRFFYQENIQFCRIARGSLAETLDHIIIAHDENYISDEEFAEFRTLNNECLKLLNGYISYLKKSKIQNS